MFSNKFVYYAALIYRVNNTLIYITALWIDSTSNAYTICPLLSITIYGFLQVYIVLHSQIYKGTFSIKHQFSDIRSCNQLSTKHKRCMFKQTHPFVGNILERRTLANRDEL